MNRKRIYSLTGWLTLVVLAACTSGDARNFDWPSDIAQLTGKDLGAWLRKAPFSNELQQTAEDQTVFTNAAQVFPFLGRYYDAVGELRYARNEPDNPIFQQETVLYQDPQWGDLFVNATLLYDDEEVFLDTYYGKGGNVLFGGADAAMATHTATLAETAVYANTTEYKTGIYWARANGVRYLLGFYQQGNLVFEAAIPLSVSDTAAALAQLNAVNDKLGLRIAEWTEATVQQLEAKGTDDTFWKDPFVGLYPDDRYMLDKVHLKMKDTPFEEASVRVKGDYYFSYDSPAGQVMLFTALKNTDANREAFDAENAALSAYDVNGQSVFYREQQAGNRVEGVAKTYFGTGKYLELTYNYPSNDPEAKDYVHGILKHVQVSRIL